MRRILIIIGVVIAVGAALAAGYIFSRRGETPAADTPSPYESVGNFPPGTLPPLPAPAPAVRLGGDSRSAEKQRFGVVAENAVLDYFVDAKNAVSLIQPDGQVVSVVGSARTTVSSAKIDGLIRASYSPDGKKILAVFGNPNRQTSIYDIPSKTWQPLSTEIKEPAWAPTGTKIAFLSSSGPEFSVLATLDLANPKAAPQPVVRVYAQGLTLAWPAPDTITLSERPSTYAKSSVWRVDVKNKTLRTPIEGLLGATARWSGDLEWGVLFTGNRAYRGGTFSLIDGAGGIKNQLAVVTFPQKCTFDQQDVQIAVSSTAPQASTGTKAAKPPPQKTERLHWAICGFPKNTREMNLAPQPDAYLQRDFYADDYIYQVNLKTGQIADFSPPAEYVVDAINLKIFGRNLFFVNRYDNRLYTITLE